MNSIPALLSTLFLGVFGAPSEIGIIGGKATNWPEKNILFNDGERQSPIDLNSKFVISKDLPTFRFINHDTDSTFLIYNDGHTAKITKNDSNCRPAILGGPLHDTYILDHIHFHWDGQGLRGSEHAVDGFKYAVEAHAVYFNSNYRSMENAKKKGDGLAVVGFFIEEGSRPSGEIEDLLSGLESVKTKGSKASMSGENALGWSEEVSHQREYYTYPGSLTTAPYSENVVFIIFPYPLSASKKTMANLRCLQSDHGPIHPNWREIQPLNKRLIVHSYNQL